MATSPLPLDEYFHLDIENECVWHGERAVQLTPKAFALLRYLIEHPNQIVTKEELLNAIWPEAIVSEGVLTTHVRAIRQALRDNAKSPRYIETVHRRGYRFLPVAASTAPVPSSEFRVQSFPQPLAPTLVGRETEIMRLHQALNKALNGERHVVFVTGEPGIGKTSLVEAFLQSLVSQPVQGPRSKVQSRKAQTLTLSPQPLTSGVWAGWGQCIEHYGSGEPYMPVLEAFGRLGRGPEGERFLPFLMQHAPTWLVQMPTLLPPTELEALQKRVAGANRERMLREMAEALETLTNEETGLTSSLVLVLEDLQWSDISTLELLSMLARRREAARLLVIGTYRPMEMLGNGHPLRTVTQELRTHRQCEELPLSLLSEAAIAEYLAMRFPGGVNGHTPLPELATEIHRRTEGNPLFMVNVVDGLLARETPDSPLSLQDAVTIGIPDTIQQMIEQQIDHLSLEDQQVLEVASVVGAEFSTAAVAAGSNDELAVTEARCAALARREQFIQTHGTSEWPDGTVAARYRFIHALYQEVLYGRVTAGRRIELHRRVGERVEQAYRSQANDLAAELAVHFERGRDPHRAIQYLEQAAQKALRRSANQEAITHLTKALSLLSTLPETPERIERELKLQLALGTPLYATKGYASPEVGKVYTRARELCRQVGNTPHLFPTIRGLWVFYLGRGEWQIARDLGEQLLSMAQQAQDSGLLVEAHRALGNAFYFIGDFIRAREHLEQILVLYDPQQHHAHTLTYGGNPKVTALDLLQGTLWWLGYPDQALQRSHEAMNLAKELASPVSLTHVLAFTNNLYRLRREPRQAQEFSEVLIDLSTKQRFALWQASGLMRRGWALAMQGASDEGLAQFKQGLNLYQTVASGGLTYYLALLAEIYAQTGQEAEAMTTLTEAMTSATRRNEHYNEAELWRLKGELLLAQEGKRQKAKIVTSPQPLTPSTQMEVEQEAKECFLRAIELARQQQAKSWELRATMSLSRLWQQQGKKNEARQLLAEIYGWFTEGFDTKDLQEAKALLAELA